MFIDAVPVPVPTPVAVNGVPGALFAAPISVKSVEPVVTIMYCSPIINAPANEWPSLVTCLDQLWKLSYLVAGPDKSVHVTLIWIRTRELLSLSIWMHNSRTSLSFILVSAILFSVHCDV